MPNRHLLAMRFALATFWLIAALPLSLFAQVEPSSLPFRASDFFDPSDRGDERFRFVFHNVENLFDIYDDSTTRDESFTPDGWNRWNYYRFKDKINKMAKTYISIGGWAPPEIIGLCEIENRYVLEKLLRETALETFGYKIIHEDSPDRRGIDVAAIYRPDRFRLLAYEAIPVRFPFDPNGRTRDILYVKGLLPNRDTLHFFINHWPSRYGGQFATAPKRNFVASLVRAKVDSIYQINPLANIVVVGDLNDEPEDESLIKHLKAKGKIKDLGEKDLFNLMYPIRWEGGTHSFQGEWGMLDQFIISSPMLRRSSDVGVLGNTAFIFDAEWLLKTNAAGKFTTNRTYQGPMYVGGFSDHLPIFIDLVLKPRGSSPLAPTGE